jgi:hypothetical protein
LNTRVIQGVPTLPEVKSMASNTEPYADEDVTHSEVADLGRELSRN